MSTLPRLVCAVGDAEEREAGVQADPEDQVAHESVFPNGRDPAQCDKWNLRDLHTLC